MTSCKGYKYAKHCILYLFTSNKHYNVPRKLQTTAGNLHLFSTEGAQPSTLGYLVDEMAEY